MNSNRIAILTLGFFCLAASVTSAIAYDVLFSAKPFPLESVRLLGSPFKRAMERDGEYLLQLEPDRLLSFYRKEAGLQPKAPPYGGWETQTIAGHTLGHYLSACSLMYASSGDVRFRERVDYIVSELLQCQRAHGDGYVGAMPGGKAALERMAAGQIEVKPFDLNGIWVPFYTLHKVLAGLLDAHRYCSNSTALEIACSLADWIDKKTSHLTEEQMQKVLSCEHGGMVEVMAELYARTGQERFLAVAKRFYHKQVMDELLQGRDILPGLHGNTQIPKIIGVWRLYELTGDWRYRVIGEFFWERVVGHHTYAVGGLTDREYFGEPDRLSGRLGQDTCEVCKTYNMLKLTWHLFAEKPEARKADYYERALYNHILASQDPTTGMMIYYLPLVPGGARKYSTPEDSFWCCVGTGMESHARYGEFIYWHVPNGILVNLFIPSELDWKERGIIVRQQTRFPYDNRIRLSFESPKPEDFVLYVRVPHWVTGLPQVQINGTSCPVAAMANGYLAIERTWKSGDSVEISFPMGPWCEEMPDMSNRVAIMYGPVVLAVDLGSDTSMVTNVILGRPPIVLLQGQPINLWLRSVPDRLLEFDTVEVGRPNDWILKPLWLLHGRRYSVYVDLLEPKEWERVKKEWDDEREFWESLVKRTIDNVEIGDDTSEKAHAFEASDSGTGVYGWRRWRQAVRGGWFQYRFKADPAHRMEIAITYWGSERGSRTHDILVEGQKVATMTLSAPRPNSLWTTTVPIPFALNQGKSEITVRLQAHPENSTGRIFDLRVLRVEKLSEN